MLSFPCFSPSRRLQAVSVLLLYFPDGVESAPRLLEQKRQLPSPDSLLPAGASCQFFPVQKDVSCRDRASVREQSYEGQEER